MAETTESISPPVNLQPHWIAVLEDDSVYLGKPSWCGLNGSTVLPGRGSSDWSRLKLFCEENGKRPKRLSLFIPGLGILTAPEGKGAYGYFEQYQSQLLTGRSECVGLGICWPEADGRGKRVIKTQIIKVGGILEHWNRYRWQACMIGDPEWKPGKDDGKPYRDGSTNTK